MPLRAFQTGPEKLVKTAFLLAVGLGTLCACSPPTEKNSASLDDKIHDYLLRHPEVIQEAQTEFRVMEDKRAVSKARPAISKHSAEIFLDRRDPFVGPENAKTVLVQFFDYRCPHCKTEAAPALLALIKKYPSVKFVFKQFPIFGGSSNDAAKTALAVWKTDSRKFLAVHTRLMAEAQIGSTSIDEILRNTGLPPLDIHRSASLRTIEDQISDTYNLAKQIGIQGTPTFIIGDTMIPGSKMDEVEALIRVSQDTQIAPAIQSKIPKG